MHNVYLPCNIVHSVLSTLNTTDLKIKASKMISSLELSQEQKKSNLFSVVDFLFPSQTKAGQISQFGGCIFAVLP